MSRYLNRGQLVNFRSPLNRGLMGWWLNMPWKRGGTIFRDLLERNHGTLTNMNGGEDWVGNKGRPGGFGGLDFDGTNDVVLIPAANLLPTPSITVSMWGYNKGAASGPDKWLASQDASGGPRNWQFIMGAAAGSAPVNPRFLVFVPGVYSASWSTTLNNHQWYHFVGTYDGAKVKLYVDGIERASTNGVGALETDAIGTMRMGAFTASGPFINAVLDDFRMYDRALSPGEVKALYLDSMFGYPKTLNWNSVLFMDASAAASNVTSGLVNGGLIA